MRAVYEAAKVIAEHFDLQPGNTITITLNAAGDPQVAYTRRLTKELVDEEAAKENPWRAWVGPEENRRD